MPLNLSFDAPSERHPADVGEPKGRDAPEHLFTVEEIRQAFAGLPQSRRSLGARLLPVIDREVRIVLRPIAIRYRRDLCGTAEDLVQDIMLLLFHDNGRILRTWDPARGMQLRSFLCLVVRRYVYRRFRGFRGNPWSSNPAEAEELAAQVDDRISERPDLLADIEYRLHLDSVLRTLQQELSERDWRLFTKIFLEDRKPAEVGVEEGMKENTVHKWCSRFQQRVRQLFGSRAAAVDARHSAGAGGSEA